MSGEKKRILFCGEASFLNTGFSTYYRELLTRLAATGKYELAEMGSYAHQNDPRVYDFIKGRWKFYGVLPQSKEEHEAFQDPKNQSPRCRGQNTWQFGDGKFSFVCADFKPDIVCTPPDELVMTSDGYKPIKDISVGDYVLSHTGKWQQIIHPMRRQFKGRLRYIYANGMADPLRLTPEHPVLVYKKRKQTNGKKSWKDIYNDVLPEFIPAGEVQEGDLVVLPSIVSEGFGDGSTGSLTFDTNTKECTIGVGGYLDNYIEEDGFIRCVNTKIKSHRIPSVIRITPDFARLIGYIISDGNIDNRGIRITFNVAEERFADDACQIFNEQLGIDASYSKCSDKEAFRVDANSVLLAEFMEKWLGDKSIPIELWDSKSVVIEQLIAGLIRGDGCYKKNTINYTSVDKHIAYNLRMLYAKLNIPSTIIKRNNVETNYGVIDTVYDVNVNSINNVRRVHSFVKKHDNIEDYITDNVSDKSCCRVQNINGHIVASVRRARYVDYHGMVYNLEVDEDNSYILQYSVHNCDIRDWWMLEYIERSPFRRYFKWIAMPTVDAEPQKEEWVATYSTANMVLSYSDFGIHVLKQYPNIKIYPIPMRPGVDLDTFKPMDRTLLKEEWIGAKDDVKVVMMLARNQARKLYPDALDGFAIMKEKYKGDPVVDKAVFIIHASWPDNQFSYDYPAHIRRISDGYYGLEYYYDRMRHDVMQTFICHDCGHTFIDWAIKLNDKGIENRGKGPKIYIPCHKCQKVSATTPDTSCGWDRSELAQLYAMADMMVQVTICFHPDTPVLTEQGWKNIQNIKVGDKVVGRDGKFHNVYKTMNTPASECVDIEVDGHIWPVTCTTNHPILIVMDEWPNDKRSLREKIAQKNPEQLKFEYKAAGDLKKGDMTVQTIPQQEIMPDYGFELDEDMAWLLGLAVADGNVNINPSTAYLRITCDRDDGISFDRMNSIAKRFDKRAYERDYTKYGRNAFDVNINDKELAIELRRLIYDGKTKKMPDGFVYWPKNLQLSFVKGLVHGDGYTISDTVSGFCNTSELVARDLDIVLKRLGLYFNSHKQIRGDKEYYPNRKDIFKFEINWTGKRSSTSTLYRDGYVLHKVKSVSISEYTGEVFNLDVNGDHNYVVSPYTVHNCEGDGMPIQEAKACGTPVLAVDYSAMAEKVRFCNDYVHLADTDENDYTVHHGGVPIPVERFYQEPETSCKRALPDREALADEMYKLLTDDDRRTEMSKAARQCTETNYDWNNLAKEWEYVLDNVKPLNRSETWDKKHEVREIPPQIPLPEGMDDDAFIDFMYLKVLGYPAVDPNGKKYWLAMLKSGQSREQVYQVFYGTLVQEVQKDNSISQMLLSQQTQNQDPDGKQIKGHIV